MVIESFTLKISFLPEGFVSIIRSVRLMNEQELIVKRDNNNNSLIFEFNSHALLKIRCRIDDENFIGYVVMSYSIIAGKRVLKILDNPQLIAKIILMYPKEISKREKVSVEKVEEILEENLTKILEDVKKKKISESEIKPVLERIVKGEKFEEVSFEKEDVNVVEERIIKLIKEKPGLNEKAYMGLIMKEFRGKISGKDAVGIIKKYLE